ncbi:hypothetical protein ACIQW5_10545 [Methylorubrum thiocyanatum]|uniref:hypothetical protein n=1 Tax=Methylorubrum thiocyanatum TaxID=47958 RepID=UPI00383B59C3
MTDSNNPVEGTASLSAEEADSKIAALLGFEPDDDETAPPAVEAEVPSDEEAEADEVHPETDTAEEEQPTEDVEPEEIEAVSFNDDTEIEVNGERVKVKDLKSGYLRQSDYTKKTQELAIQRQQIEGHLRAEYGNHLRQIEQSLIDHFPQEPNWLELAQDNPAQYAVEREAWNKRLADLNGVRHLRHIHEQNAVAERNQAKAQAQAYENLVQMHPEFAVTQDGKAAPAAEELIGFATQEVGLTTDLLEEITDARYFSLMYDAMRWRRQEAQKSKTIQAVANKPPLAKPGVTQSKASAAQTDLKNQMARLKRTGKSEDADNLIASVLFGN